MSLEANASPEPLDENPGCQHPDSGSYEPLSRKAELAVRNLPASAGDVKDACLVPGLGRSPEGGQGRPTPVLLPGESHRHRSLVGCSPLGHNELGTTEVT